MSKSHISQYRESITGTVLGDDFIARTQPNCCEHVHEVPDHQFKSTTKKTHLEISREAHIHVQVKYFIVSRKYNRNGPWRRLHFQNSTKLLRTRPRGPRSSFQ